jgi:hypothetical protein
MDKATADALASDPAYLVGSARGVLKLGDASAQAGGGWQRPLEIALQCDPDPNNEGCAVGGVGLNAPWPRVLRLPGPGGSDLTFAVKEVFPAAAPESARAHVLLGGAPEILALVRAGDRDDCLDDRAAIVQGVVSRRGGLELDVTLRMGVDRSQGGLRYRGQMMKAGAPFTLATERYVLTGTVLSVGAGREEEPR